MTSGEARDCPCHALPHELYVIYNYLPCCRFAELVTTTLASW